MPDGIKKVFQGPVTQVDTTDLEELGTIRFEGNNVYKYITYHAGATTTGAVGDVVGYVSTTGYANSDVTPDVSATDGVGAGVLKASMTDGQFGWIQIKGAATLSTAIGSGADGAAITTNGASDRAATIIDGHGEYQIGAVMGNSAKTIVCDFPF